MYWKKGTTQGAFACMIVGSGLSLLSIYVEQYYPNGFNLFGYPFPTPNGKLLSFYTTFFAMGTYIVVSLSTCTADFDLDRMLHRGKYAAIKVEVDDAAVQFKRRVGWSRILGFDEDYTLADKWIAGGLLGMSCFWSAVALIGTIWNLAVSPWSNTTWSIFWEVVGLGLPVFFAVVTGIWFTWGGVRDLSRLFRRLREHKSNPLDDGTVVDNQNLDEFALERKKA
jgi:SSS family solute:Na+ symporter